MALGNSFADSFCFRSPLRRDTRTKMNAAPSVAASNAPLLPPNKPSPLRRARGCVSGTKRWMWMKQDVGKTCVKTKVGLQRVSVPREGAISQAPTTCQPNTCSAKNVSRVLRSLFGGERRYPPYNLLTHNASGIYTLRCARVCLVYVLTPLTAGGRERGHVCSSKHQQLTFGGGAKKNIEKRGHHVPC
jgi:hypothetical protein